MAASVARLLRALDGYGRADVGLDVRGTHEVRGNDKIKVHWSDPDGQSRRQVGVLRCEADGHHLWIGGDLTIPASSDDVSDLVERWKRELARAAGLHAWEPRPTAGPEETPAS